MMHLNMSIWRNVCLVEPLLPLTPLSFLLMTSSSACAGGGPRCFRPQFLLQGVPGANYHIITRPVVQGRHMTRLNRSI
jgi:hypothetical protein